MPTPQGAGTRAMLELTIGATKSMQRRAARDREMGLAEIEQQFQFEISGNAAITFAFAEVDVPFDYPFYYAPGQRDSDFNRPHFWFGAETSVAVAIVATVVAWELDEDNGAVIGATVAIGVAAGQPAVPTQGVGVPFTGWAHLTFQGFSALAEDEIDLAVE
jgi:hypothetical protein